MPWLEVQSAHTPMQRTQTVQAGRGLVDPSSSPRLLSRGRETWMGSSQHRWGRSSRRVLQGERLESGSRVGTASQRDLRSNFGLETGGTGGLYSSAGRPRATLGSTLSIFCDLYMKAYFCSEEGVPFVYVQRCQLPLFVISLTAFLAPAWDY